MNSSTSSSEPGLGAVQSGAGAPDWAGFATLFLAAAALLCGVFLAAACLLDPYDTGRTPLDLKPGVRPQGPRMAAASRGRDRAFEAAILGNSHVQLLAPHALTPLVGLAFVSLTTPGAGPKETLALADWFLRRRAEPARALVVGVDEHWCTSDPAMPNPRPFPFWLLSRDLADYLVGLLRFDTVEELGHRLAYLGAGAAPRARPDGYWDYEPTFAAQGASAARERRAGLDAPVEIGGGNVAGPFPAARALEVLLAAHAPEAVLILLRPPAYATSLPTPGSRDAQAHAACREAFADLAARRPRSALLDWRTDRHEIRNLERFFDHAHYRRALAALVEADIAAAIARLR